MLSFLQELSNKIDDLAKEKQSSTNVGKLFSQILTRRLEKLKSKKKVTLLRETITVDELIEWKVWSSMLKVASKFNTILVYSGTSLSKYPSSIIMGESQIIIKYILP